MTRVNIGTAEKLPARVRLVATGTSGHGSVPRLDNALIHLARRGREGGPLGNADAAERHHAHLLREAGDASARRSAPPSTGRFSIHASAAGAAAATCASTSRASTRCCARRSCRRC